jgi:hypothetical protein
MADISGPRSEAISDLGPGSQDEPYQAAPAKRVAPPKTKPADVPEIGTPDAEEKLNLDEMA